MQATTYGHNVVTVTGAVSSALLAFSYTWLLSWAIDSDLGVSLGKLALLLFITATVVAFLVTYARRQWLQYLRKQTIDMASAFVANLQSFDSAQASTITLIQEVELVSRGYKMYAESARKRVNLLTPYRSNPLPPITRIEGQGQPRRCPRLRRSLETSYVSFLPVMVNAIVSLEEVLDQNDMHRFLDVYDVQDADLQEALQGYTAGDQEDDDGSLKHLRVHQHRYQSLRRALLCSLLAIPATGQKADALRWRTAIDVMERIGESTAASGDSLKTLLAEDERE